MPFDPYDGEIVTLPKGLRPSHILPLGGEQLCRIYERPLHPAFLRPFTAEDVLNTLTTVPVEYLRELRSIYLMGGTRKQETIAFSDLYCFGSYRKNTRTIYLFAFPKKLLELEFEKPLKPSRVQEYARAGAVFEMEGDKQTGHFSEESLRKFYLSDVLIHEVGHHADRHNLARRTDDREGYAEWFVRDYNAGQLNILGDR